MEVKRLPYSCIKHTYSCIIVSCWVWERPVIIHPMIMSCCIIPSEFKKGILPLVPDHMGSGEWRNRWVQSALNLESKLVTFGGPDLITWGVGDGGTDEYKVHCILKASWSHLKTLTEAPDLWALVYIPCIYSQYISLWALVSIPCTYS